MENFIIKVQMITARNSVHLESTKERMPNNIYEG